MNKLNVTLADAILLEPQVFGDHRGFFTESYNKDKYQSIGINSVFIQDNQSMSAQAGTLRGLHYQMHPMAQSKLVSVLAGAIYDVIVDIRQDSPTFGQWEGFILSAENKRQLFVPQGFAHGFCTLVPNTHVFYKVDQSYSPEHDRGIAWNDPNLNIDWPVSNPILSDKDKQHPKLQEADNNFTYSGGSL